MYHVIAIPTDSHGTYEGSMLGEASTEAEAISLCEKAGYRVIRDGEGGQINAYDADDAPRIYGYEADGIGAIGVTVEIT